MAERMHRTQILLEPEQHRYLTALAQSQGRSLSDIIRDLVSRYLIEQDAARAEQLAALERIRHHRAQVLARRDGRPLEIDVAALVEELREERDREVLDV